MLRWRYPVDTAVLYHVKERKVARRTGIPSMITNGKKLQNLITDYTVTITLLHPLNDGLLTALADCAVCLVTLLQELAAVREQGD